MLCEIRKRVYISILCQAARIRVIKIFSYVREMRAIYNLCYDVCKYLLCYCRNYLDKVPSTTDFVITGNS